MRKFYYKLVLSIKKYFGFSTKEANGFLVLIFLMLIIIFIPVLYDRYYPDREVNQAKDSQILDSLLCLMEENVIDNPKINKVSKDHFVEKTFLFSFDPNSATDVELIKLGIQPYMAQRIIKYRAKGGIFKVKKDLLKIYSFPTSTFDRLKGYILLPDTIARIHLSDHKTKTFEKELKSLDLNTADSLQLEKVYGIGFKLAARIIKYRDKLGGFVSMNQLKEVYGLDTAVIIEIDKKFDIRSDFIPLKLNVNTASFDLLKNHPYLGYKWSKVVLAYKTQHGRIQDIEQFKQIKVFTESDILKLTPYLEF